MGNISESNLIDSLNWRYAVKKFDSSRAISDKTWNALEDSLILTPSSYGLQPWKFMVIRDLELRKKLTAVSWGQKQVEDCSHLVVFLMKEKLDEAHIDHYLKSMAEIRGGSVEALAGFKKMLLGDLITGGRSKIITEWAARQIYISLGNFMTSAAVLGVDTCPMEGIDPQKYDEILGLTNSDYKTVVACPAGYRASDDKYAQMKKVRFSKEELIIRK